MIFCVHQLAKKAIDIIATKLFLLFVACSCKAYASVPMQSSPLVCFAEVHVVYLGLIS